MSRCPKCGSTTITGPVYVSASALLGAEALRYRCCICGYAVDKPTRDAAALAPFVGEATQ